MPMVPLHRLLAGLLFSLLAILTSSAPTAWSLDVGTRTNSAHGKVGRIEFDLPEGHSTGTAFLVGYCTVLTSFHVAFGPWYVTALRPPSATNAGTFVLTGVTLPDGSHPTSRVVPVIWGDYTGPDRQYRKPSEDWVLLATEDCLGVPYGYLTMADLALQEDGADTGAFVSVGYSSGRQMVDPRCSIRLVAEEMSGGVLLHDCAAMPGDSGAPILRRGTGQVVAITSGYRAKGEGINCGPAGQSLRGGEASCSNTSVRLRHDIIGRMADADGAVITQRALLRLGYRAGAYGVIDDPSVRIAIREAQRDMGLPVNGEWSISLSKVLNLRRSGVLATTSMLNARD